MDSPETVVDPDNEVRKLQELVKKLERQNEVLRGKQAPNFGNGDFEQDNQNNVNGNDQIADIAKVKLKSKFALDDFEDVNFSDLSIDDDSWLYSSPKPVTPQLSRETLLSWVRQDFDHPSPEVETTRRALIYRLEEVARMRHSSSSPVISSQPFASRSAGALSRSTEDSNHTPSRYTSHRKSGLAPPGLAKMNFDTNTFTRSKRASAPMHGEGDQCQEGTYTSTATDISDIENLAKQQEENLRQSITPANRKAMRAKHALMEGDNGARLSPSRFDLEGTYLLQHRGSLGSDGLPASSPHNSNNLSNSIDSRGRSSLPSTPGLQYQSHNSSDSSLERHSVNSDEINLAPEAIRAPTSRLQQSNYNSSHKQGIPMGVAPGLAQQQHRGISPQRTSGLPTPKRQLIRPSSASRSSLPMFRRTNIPSPKPTSSGGTEETWRDGCF
uniref:SLAIN motif-containing protein 2 n=1 Tax=Arion vulgaris TaxID=1028688 RepID=A0A0B6ZTP4_9EUPU